MPLRLSFSVRFLQRHHHVSGRRWYSPSNYPYPIATSSTLTLKKSTFISYACHLDEPQTSIPLLLDYLQNSSQFKSKRATHFMYAYTSGEPAALGSHDGGESGAGERLERLLGRGCNSQNVAVVVLRWYGGIALGPDRWKCISTVAKDALEKGGFRASPDDKKGKARKAKK